MNEPEKRSLNYPLRRREVVQELLKSREGLLVVAGLGAPAWDATASSDHPLPFPFSETERKPSCRLPYTFCIKTKGSICPLSIFNYPIIFFSRSGVHALNDMIAPTCSEHDCGNIGDPVPDYIQLFIERYVVRFNEHIAEVLNIALLGISTFEVPILERVYIAPSTI